MFLIFISDAGWHCCEITISSFFSVVGEIKKVSDVKLLVSLGHHIKLPYLEKVWLWVNHSVPFAKYMPVYLWHPNEFHLNFKSRCSILDVHGNVYITVYSPWNAVAGVRCVALRINVVLQRRRRRQLSAALLQQRRRCAQRLDRLRICYSRC